ncbi:MAG: hypothetical protein HXX08_07080 [Chloroflexi bacterium]|uniref:Toxin YqcG C-terminal domain-containing protein n=1 Tax=Candidatus Chlorohelix allophototropha TaxID=3003348 RepID=A0A8T7M3A7_9CHLR|nr:hypothetical protein [Chloroflexota bacterium]
MTRRGYDLDHFDTWVNKKIKLQEQDPPPTRKEVIDEYNSDLRIQCPSCNQGHKYEGKRGAYSE